MHPGTYVFLPGYPLFRCIFWSCSLNCVLLETPFVGYYRFSVILSRSVFQPLLVRCMWSILKLTSYLITADIEGHRRLRQEYQSNGVPLCCNMWILDLYQFHLNSVKRYFNFNWKWFFCFVCKALSLLRKSILFAPLSKNRFLY